MNNIIIIGDIHAKNKQPYRKHINSFFNYLLENYKEDVMIFLGDLFDISSPHNEIRLEIGNYLRQFHRVIILTGNHDISRRSGNAIKPLSILDNVKIITDVQDMNINDISFKFIPYKENCKEEYETLTGDYDYILTHITPPQCAFGDEGIRLNMNGVYIHGHTHQSIDFIDKNNNEHYIIGVPIATRHLEDKHKPIIYKIDNDNLKEIELKKYLKFEIVRYGDEPENKEDNIINVIDAPSVNSVYEMYKNCYIRREGIVLKIIEENVEQFKFSEDSLEQHFIDFEKEREEGGNKLKSGIKIEALRRFEKVRSGEI